MQSKGQQLIVVNQRFIFGDRGTKLRPGEEFAVLVEKIAACAISDAVQDRNPSGCHFPAHIEQVLP